MSPKDERRTDQSPVQTNQLPKAAAFGFAAGLIPLAYLGHPFVGLLLGTTVGGVGYIAIEYRQEVREQLSRVVKTTEQQ